MHAKKGPRRLQSDQHTYGHRAVDFVHVGAKPASVIAAMRTPPTVFIILIEPCKPPNRRQKDGIALSGYWQPRTPKGQWAILHISD
jgi:hypothetical protein